MIIPIWLASWCILILAADSSCFAVAGSALSWRSHSRSSLLWVFHHFVLRSLAWNLSALQEPDTAFWNSFFSSLLELRKLDTKPYCSARSEARRVGKEGRPTQGPHAGA